MNFFKRLWRWFLNPKPQPQTPALTIILDEEECCDNTECQTVEEPTPVEVQEEPETTLQAVEEKAEVEVTEAVTEPDLVGDLLQEMLLSEGISETVIRKYEIIKAFEGWYDGPVDADSIRESIQSFKDEQGGVIKAKLSRVQ